MAFVSKPGEKKLPLIEYAIQVKNRTTFRGVEKLFGVEKNIKANPVRWSVLREGDDRSSGEGVMAGEGVS